jgi:hypothetical protein
MMSSLAVVRNMPDLIDKQYGSSLMRIASLLEAEDVTQVKESNKAMDAARKKFEEAAKTIREKQRELSGKISDKMSKRLLPLVHIDAFNIWKDTMLGNYNSIRRKLLPDALMSSNRYCGLLQLYKPTCPACVQFKTPLDEALKLLDLPYGYAAAIDTSCMNDSSCPLGAMLMNMYNTSIWDGTVPSLFGVVLEPRFQLVAINIDDYLSAKADDLASYLSTMLAITNLDRAATKLQNMDNIYRLNEARNEFLGASAIVDELGQTENQLEVLRQAKDMAALMADIGYQRDQMDPWTRGIYDYVTVAPLSEVDRAHIASARTTPYLGLQSVVRGYIGDTYLNHANRLRNTPLTNQIISALAEASAAKDDKKPKQN